MSEQSHKYSHCALSSLWGMCSAVDIELSFVSENVWTKLYACHWFSKGISGHELDNKKSQWHQGNILLKEGNTMFYVTRRGLLNSHAWTSWYQGTASQAEIHIPLSANMTAAVMCWQCSKLGL